MATKDLLLEARREELRQAMRRAEGKKPFHNLGNTSLIEQDPEIYEILEKEKSRQYSGLELIASENFTSRAVMETLGSALTNKYSEGLPGARYYGGNQFIDLLERMAQKRALEAYRLDPELWGVNVQPYSGSIANFAAYTGIIGPHARIMGLNLPSGGHLTHGYQTKKKKISATSIYFESMPYDVHPETGLIDYDQLQNHAKYFNPDLLICGASAYPRDWDYERMRKIADESDAYLLCDMAHMSGLIAAQLMKNPFEHCDVVTSTTHKTLRGPRAGMIFFRKKDRDGKPTDLEEKVNFAIFPTMQGGPHNNAIGAAAVAFKEAAQPAFREYAQQVINNAKTLAEKMVARGWKLVTGGTDNHLIVWDLRPEGITGSKMQLILEQAHITVNMNTVPGDKSALTPGGIRIGTPALTSRGMKEEHMDTIVSFLDRALKISIACQDRVGKKIKDYVPCLLGNEEIDALRADVHGFAHDFPIPGFEIDEMLYRDTPVEYDAV